MSEPKTSWPRASHFICAEQCRFGMTDAVNGVIVSTVGDYHPEHRPDERMTIGCDRYYETMVFPDSGRRCTEPDCPCGGIPEPRDWTEIDFAGYQTEAEARLGHALMVAKYASRETSPVLS